MDDVSRIKEKLNIVDFIGNYVSLKRTGKNLKGVCPFHKEKTPSFVVSEDIQRYKCFGCGKSGDIFNFVMEKEGYDFGEAIKYLAEKAGIELSSDLSAVNKSSKINEQIYKINETAANLYHELLIKHPLGKKGLEYLKKRGVTPEIIKEFKLGYAPDSWDSLSKAFVKKGFSYEILQQSGLSRFRKDVSKGTYDLFRARLLFPLIDHLNKYVGFSGRAMLPDQNPKYLNTPETPVFHKEKFVFGLNLSKKFIGDKKFAILVEGHFDMLSLYQHGYKNVVATGGTALTAAQLALIKRYSDNLILVFDGDEAGVNAALRGIDIVQTAGLNLQIAVLPSDVKDPDELMQKDPKSFQNVLDRALPIWDFYFNYASKKFNFDNIFEKKKASDFLLGVINQISDEVVKGQYIKKFSSLFEVPDATVLSQLEKVGKTPPKIVTSNSMQQDSIQNSPEQKDILGPEFYMCYLLVNSPRSVINQNLAILSDEYFGNPLIKEFFMLLSAESENLKQSTQKIDIRKFYDRISTENPNIQKVFEKIYLVDISTNFQDQELLNKELSKTLNRLKTEFLNRKIREKAKEIKKLEALSNLEDAKKLQKEVNTYIGELSQLHAAL